MGYAPLDDNFHDNAKILSLNHDEFRLYVCALAYSNKYATSGRISAAVARALSGAHGVKGKAVAGLVAKGCWHESEAGYEIHDAAKYDFRARKSEQGRRAAEARWANAEDAGAMPEHMPKASRSNAPRGGLPRPLPQPQVAKATKNLKPFRASRSARLDALHPEWADQFVALWNENCGELPRMRKPPSRVSLRSLIAAAWEIVDGDATLLGLAVAAAARDSHYREQGYGFETFCRHLDGRWLGMAERVTATPKEPTTLAERIAASTNPHDRRVAAILARAQA